MFIVSNFVHDVVRESDDQGAIDIYLDPSYAGNFYAWNVWKDVGGDPYGRNFSAGIRFDDCISAQVVYANRLIRCGRGTMGAVSMNGGRLNVIDSNVMSECGMAFGIGARSESEWTNRIYKLVKDKALDAEKGVDIRLPPYAERYPRLAQLFEKELFNSVTRNVFAGGTPLPWQTPGGTVVKGNRRVEGPVEPAELRGLVPTETEVGVRRTAAYLRAKANDR